jgi:toxin CptA
MQQQREKHNASLPTARKIRRACSKELYRTMKRLKSYVPAEAVAQAEDLYFKKVMLNLMWIVDNTSNRKVLSDWWEEQVCPEIAVLWNVEEPVLARAFRDAFGG